MPHPAGVVIGRGVRVGDNVSILSGVVLGGSGRGIVAPGKEDGYPEIGDGCWLFAGAKVLGPIKVGRDSLVGANSVLARSVGPNSIVTSGPVVIREGARADEAGREPSVSEIELLTEKTEALERRIAEAETLLRDSGLEKRGGSQAGGDDARISADQEPE